MPNILDFLAAQAQGGFAQRPAYGEGANLAVNAVIDQYVRAKRGQRKSRDLTSLLAAITNADPGQFPGLEREAIMAAGDIDLGGIAPPNTAIQIANALATNRINRTSQDLEGEAMAAVAGIPAGIGIRNPKLAAALAQRRQQIEAGMAAAEAERAKGEFRLKEAEAKRPTTQEAAIQTFIDSYIRARGIRGVKGSELAKELDDFLKGTQFGGEAEPTSQRSAQEIVETPEGFKRQPKEQTDEDVGFSSEAPQYTPKELEILKKKGKKPRGAK